MYQHDQEVQKISTRMRDFYARKEPYRIFHGSTNSTRNYTVDPAKMIDTRRLYRIISIDLEKLTALVEPNVPMDRLYKATSNFGLVPPVVMEFPGITVGGGFAGTSGESSSFKHGFFDATINWAQIVLPNGDIVKASETENSDLFHGAAGSFGTLGVATLFEIRLIKAKDYVEVEYRSVPSLTGTFDALKHAYNDSSNDYVDGIMLEKNRGLVITGKFTNTISPDAPLQGFREARAPWFYIHADRITRPSFFSSASTTIVKKETVSLMDYLFRYDRGAFWTGAYAFKYFLVPFNRITRWALDDFMKTRVMYHALHASGHARQYMIQDLAIPAHNAEKFVEYVDETFGFYPLWLCPLRTSPTTTTRKVSMHPQSTSPSGDEDDGWLVNVGVWGPGPSDYKKFVQVNRDLEREVRELGGMKWLYAQAFYTEDEFWDIYGPRQEYDALRRRYHADHLPDVYEKVRVDLSEMDGDKSYVEWIKDAFWATWPMTGLYGVLQTLVSKDYLLSKDRKA
ncbi:hypothetical protein AAFC00_005589 [Neodothiora populina]|uniref:Delta(24)-sterol reductase n=1 Tax=Neodothiora populina TaxID=2781224 RepID=A0ABR3PMH2_9PEZI